MKYLFSISCKIIYIATQKEKEQLIELCFKKLYICFISSGSESLLTQASSFTSVVLTRLGGANLKRHRTFLRDFSKKKYLRSFPKKSVENIF